MGLIAGQHDDRTGAKIGGTVYSDSLSGVDGPAASYIAMMEHNIRQFAAALAN